MNIRFFSSMQARRLRHCKWYLVAALAALGANFGLHKAMAVPPAPAAAPDRAQVLTRGPVHEAFAETVTFDPQPGIVVPKAPPAAIEELPPDQKPEGANVAWIPGYWAWDDERSDFLWVSGIWRDLPPGRQWVPGYWGQSGQGEQWTSGYWADAQVSNVEYLPEPPATAEAGPNIASPFAGQHLAAGQLDLEPEPLCLASRFLGRRAAGLGLGSRPLRLGSARLCFCRRLLGSLHRPPRCAVCTGLFQWGHVFAAWFLLLADDGDRPGRFTDNLFLRPRYQHYYFGDYYAGNYQAAGFYPSYSYNSGRNGYDPIYAHERGSIARTASGSSAWQPTSRTAAIMRKPGRRARGRPKLPSAPAHCGPAKGAPRWPCPSPNSRRVPIVRCGSSPSIRQKDRSWLSTGKRCNDSASSGRNWRVRQRYPQPRYLRTNSRRPPGSFPSLRSWRGQTRSSARTTFRPKMHVAPKPDLRVEAKPRATPSPEKPQPRTVNRLPLDTPKPEPRVERPAPKPEPRMERPAPKPEPKVERPQPQPRAERPRAETGTQGRAAGPET